MLHILEAQKELKRIGTSKATGDALRFMYANLIAFETSLNCEGNSTNWPIPKIYAELGAFSDDAIRDGYKQIGAKWKGI